MLHLLSKAVGGENAEGAGITYVAINPCCCSRAVRVVAVACHTEAWGCQDYVRSKKMHLLIFLRADRATRLVPRFYPDPGSNVRQ